MQLPRTICICLLYFSIVGAQECGLSVGLQISRGNGFVQEFRIEKIVEGNAVPNVQVSWKLRYPTCFSLLTITFRDESGRFLAQETVERTSIVNTTAIQQGTLACNIHVKAEFNATDYEYSLVASSEGTLYTGGDPDSAPTGSPGAVNALQDPMNSGLILVNWTALPCLQTQAPITNYIIQYGRSGVVDEVRTSTTSALFIRSSSSTETAGLGFLDQGVLYFFRVAAKNANGVGPFSNDVTGQVTPITDQVTPITAQDEGTRARGSSDSTPAVAVSVSLAIMLLLVGILFIILLMIWRQKYFVKRQSFNVRDMDDIELAVTRNSVIVSTQTIPICEMIAVEPTIRSYQNEVYIDEGEEVNLQVDFEGTPEPTITWFFNGIRLEEDEEDGHEVMQDCSLYFAQVSRGHTGTYDFIVSNIQGSVEGCTKLVINLNEQRPKRRGKASRIHTKPVGVALFREFVAKNHESNDSGFSEDFENLSSGESGQKMLIGRMETNRCRNRFRRIVCYDTNRVELEPISKYPHMLTDYINASYVDGCGRDKNYIATQTPLSQTIPDFWRLVWQEKVQLIVMLNSTVGGKLKKNEIYWPSEGGSRDYAPFMVTHVECQVFPDYTIRTIQLAISRDARHSMSFRNVRKVTQFHFTSWPDLGVPWYVGPFLVFLHRVRSQHKPTKGPVLVHCKEGAGRTGVFIAINNTLAQAARESTVDVVGVVCRMRTQRMKMVQTQDQYMFIHDAVLDSLTCGNTQVPASSMKKAVARLARPHPGTALRGYTTQFQVLEQVSPNPSDVVRDAAFSCPDKNRSSDFLPSDERRVCLKGNSQEETYIHASIANGYKQRKRFIIAQAPMKNTVEDFWRMIHEQGVAVIVMLSQLFEDGKEVCHQYWPGGVSKVSTIDGEQHGNLVVYTLQTRRQNGFTIRSFGITGPHTPNMRQVTQFQMTNWTLAGTCTDTASVMAMIDQLFIAQRRTGNKPIVIHGFDTVSRCGVLCSLLNSIEHCKTESVVDILQIVKALRIQKPGSVQTVAQYQFVYNLVMLFLNSFTLYSNFK